jgi:hypothetical protein
MIYIDFLFLQEKSSEVPQEDYFGSDQISAEKVIVFLPQLLGLFDVCHVPGCGQVCDQDNQMIHFSGAMVSITVTCNNGHEFKWKSSPTVGHGKNQVAAVNVLLGTYGYLCGINVKKVSFEICNHVTLLAYFQFLEFFGCLRIVCISRSFIYQIQTKVLYNVIWAFWQYMQVIALILSF